MKEEKWEKLTRAGLRITQDFRQTLLEMVASQSFEKVSMQELCQQAGYPRATFYNYYDDKFDLLEDCFRALSRSLQLEEHHDLEPAQALEVLFGRLYDFFDGQKDWLASLKRSNSLDGQFWAYFTLFSRREIEEMFATCLHFQNPKLPLDIISRHYSNSIFLLLDRIFLQQKHLIKAEAQASLNLLLSPFL